MSCSVPGHFGFWFRVESPAEAAAETLQPPDPGRRQPHPEPLEVLRRRQELRVQGHLEDSHQGARATHGTHVERGER